MTANLNSFFVVYVTLDQVINCSVCLTSRFLIASKCGHSLCCDFYINYFIKRAFHRNNDNFCQCPVYRGEVNLFNTHTIFQEKSLNPESSVSKYHLSLNIKCSNVSCNLYFNSKDIIKHEMLKC